jgi:hypothetical protein
VLPENLLIDEFARLTTSTSLIPVDNDAKSCSDPIIRTRWLLVFDGGCLAFGCSHHATALNQVTACFGPKRRGKRRQIQPGKMANVQFDSFDTL